MTYTRPATTSHTDPIVVLARIRRTQYGFLTAADVAILATHAQTRLTQCLVRCGACRFLAAAQDVQHLIDIITRDGTDYVRDVSLSVNVHITQE